MQMPMLSCSMPDSDCNFCGSQLLTWLDANFTVSKAVYYPNSDAKGTETGACEYGAFGATLNNGDVSASASLYRNGVGCGACYQVRCTNPYYCSPSGVTIVITDSGASDGTDFILSQHALAGMGQNKDAGATLLNLGYVGIEYRRVPCIYPGKNIIFKITESSHFPYYFEFEIWYQQGNQDIIAVQLCEIVNLTCQLLSRTHGAVWAAVSPPSGPLSIRMLFSSGAPHGGSQKWLVPTSIIPQNWTAGATYDSGVQVQLQ
ncbi:expansin-like B1 isoform X3 [Panicum hallii]|nr:expansin-like B1 isoform X3 [Panicum hallii]